jgi:hypothetical protein
MDLNPYLPPLVAGPTLADEQSAGDCPAPRPIGIWLLSGLHLLAGLFFLSMIGIVLWTLNTDGSNPTALPLGFLAGIYGVMAALALGSATGLWRGQRWGWWLSAFYYVWGALGAVADLLLVEPRLDPADGESIIDPLPSKLIQFAIYALILQYLFKGTVRDFFRLQSLSSLNSLMLLGLLAIVVLAATYLGGTWALQIEQP